MHSMNENNQILHDKLTALRKEKGLTQCDIAQSLGISDKTYSKWETGENEINVSSLLVLANFYHISPAYFFSDTETSDTEQFVKSKYATCDFPESADIAFDIQFHSIFQLAQKAFQTRIWEKSIKYPIPDNRIRTVNDECSAVTMLSDRDIFFMMYNGKDANISVSQMPAEDKYSWLKTERKQLSAFLSLLGDEDFLKCLTHLMGSALSKRYTAGYLSEMSGVTVEKVTDLLDAAVKFNLCSSETVFIGAKEETVYTTIADKMLISLLTLAHILLPTTEYCGHFKCSNSIVGMLNSEESNDAE